MHVSSIRRPRHLSRPPADVSDHAPGLTVTISSHLWIYFPTEPETGRLRTLGEDFKDSFWYEISWFAYRNFSDSTLGFRAEINQADDGLRITFSERSKRNSGIHAGPRLIEEYLYEFFEIVRRDIDPSVFRRMYGRKLKIQMFLLCAADRGILRNPRTRSTDAESNQSGNTLRRASGIA